MPILAHAEVHSCVRWNSWSIAKAPIQTLAMKRSIVHILYRLRLLACETGGLMALLSRMLLAPTEGVDSPSPMFMELERDVRDISRDEFDNLVASARLKPRDRARAGSVR